MSKLPDDIFRYIEYELYNLEKTKKELQRLDVDSKEAISEEVDLLTSKAIIKAGRIIREIERAKKELNEYERKLFHLKYDIGKSWQQITIDLNISESTYYRWRKKIVELVAKKMGFQQKSKKNN